MQPAPPPAVPIRHGVRRENRTRYVALGMLTLHPMSVYAMRQMIERSVGHFWQESFGQLYPTLHGLEREGLVERAGPRESGEGARPGRAGAVYAITPAGRQALAAWLERPPLLEPQRSELLLKVFFAGACRPEVMVSHLAGVAAHLQADLGRLRAVAASWDDQVRGHPDAPFWRLTLDFGTEVCDRLLAWVEGAQRTIRETHARRAAGSARSADRPQEVSPARAGRASSRKAPSRRPGARR